LTTQAADLRHFRPADNKVSVRAFLVVAIVLATLTGLLSVPWLLAVVFSATFVMMLWALPAPFVGVVVLLAALIPNFVLFNRYQSRLSRRGLWLSVASLSALVVQGIVAWLRAWPSVC
jgi:hypothetical protein